MKKWFHIIVFATVATTAVMGVAFFSWWAWTPTNSVAHSMPLIKATEPAPECDRPGLDENLNFVGNYEDHQIPLLANAAAKEAIEFNVIPGSYCCKEGICSLTGYRGFQIEPGSGENFWDKVCKLYPDSFSNCD